jgi:DNA-binding XRE family transcriptional regulator
MDVEAALEIINSTIETLDRFDDNYARVRSPSVALTDTARTFAAGLSEKARQTALLVERNELIPLLELARQIAAHVGGDAESISAEPDKDWTVKHPYERNRTALGVLRTQLGQKQRMAFILGPAGPQLSTAKLHPTIWNAAANLFDGGHFRQAVQTAGTALEGHLQTIAGPSLSGQDLAKLFASDGTGVRLHFDFLDPNGKTYTSAREGSASLIRGTMMAVRNLVSHPEWPDPDETEALEMLAVLSYVAHLVDRSKILP